MTQVTGSDHPSDVLYACRRHGQQGAPPFEGDVSEWGKTQLDSYYDSEIEPEVSGISSGISPRDMRPRVRPFYMQEATEVCRHAREMCALHVVPLQLVFSQWSQAVYTHVCLHDPPCA
jgi:hypothetical protein